MIRYSICAALIAAAFTNPALANEAHAHPAGTAGTILVAEGEAAAVQAEDVALGDLVLSGAFARATLPGAPVAGGYVTITNNGSDDDRLVAAESAIAEEVQIHEMIMDGDVMKMRRLGDGLPVPAGATVTLEPGGLHLMFMTLKEPLVEGESVEVVLTFEKAGKVALDLAIAASGAQATSH